MALIEINGIEFWAYHGCFKEEAITGNKFEVDLALDYNAEIACISDNLEHAIDYQAVYNVVKEEMMINSALLEHVATRIIKAVLTQFDSVEEVEVTVYKMNPALGGKISSVSVTINSEDL